MIRVLVVDDHAVVRSGVVAVLEEDADVEVVGQASRAGEAVEAAAALSPDVVVLDARLPDADGMDACEQMRRRGLPSRVVIFTQLTTERVIHRAFEAGAAGFVVKQADTSVLVDAVRAVANGDSFLDPAVAERVVNVITKRRRTPGPHGLTPAELKVVSLLAEGLSNQEMADRLQVSSETVKTHLSHAMDKTGIRDRAELAALVVREGLA